MAKDKRLEEIDVVRNEDGRVYVYGRRGKERSISVHDARTGQELQEEQRFKEKSPFFSDAIRAAMIGSVTGTGAFGGGFIAVCYSDRVQKFLADRIKTATDAEILVLGVTSAGLLLPMAISAINYIRPSVRQRRGLTVAYNHDAKVLRERNEKDLEDAISPIRLYQGTIDEVSGELGVGLKRVDTGKPETFIYERDSHALRIKALILGADALVHYQPGSSIATPVRFTEKTKL